MKNAIILVVGLTLLFTNARAAVAGNDTTVVIKTSVLCEMCKDKIERELVFEKGVKEVKVDLTARTVKVTYRKDKNNMEKIKKAISKMGYRANNVPADPKGFKKLPACCKEEGCGKD